MERLAKEIQKNGYLYRLVERTSKITEAGGKKMDKAIYGQYAPTGIIAHEVFYIRTQKPSTITIKGQVIVYEEKELFPKDEDFGKTAWSVSSDFNKAMVAYTNL
jgi:hypothetical protein